MTRPETTRTSVRRPVVLGAAWTASAAAAIGLGFLAVSLVDASASPGTAPVAAASSAADPTASASATPSTSPSATGQMATVAGTVYANCIGGPPVLAGVPVGGWAVDDSDDAGEVEFRNGTQKLEVHVVCTGGSPQFSVEGPRADDSRGGSSSAGTSSSSPASSSSSDDSGRDDSGHDSSGRGSDDSGSDDSSGDDSSGSGGGGHGSDD